MLVDRALRVVAGGALGLVCLACDPLPGRALEKAIAAALSEPRYANLQVECGLDTCRLIGMVRSETDLFDARVKAWQAVPPKSMSGLFINNVQVLERRDAR